jgi:hypothetical protein
MPLPLPDAGLRQHKAVRRVRGKPLHLNLK